MTDNDLIPCTDELNRLKEFLAESKIYSDRARLNRKRDNWSDHCVLGQAALFDHTVKNYGGPYVERP